MKMVKLALLYVYRRNLVPGRNGSSLLDKPNRERSTTWCGENIPTPTCCTHVKDANTKLLSRWISGRPWLKIAPTGKKSGVGVTAYAPKPP